jgi:hypothetical protein
LDLKPTSTNRLSLSCRLADRGRIDPSLYSPACPTGPHFHIRPPRRASRLTKWLDNSILEETRTGTYHDSLMIAIGFQIVKN